MKITKLLTLLVGMLLLTNCGKEDVPIVEIEKEQENPKPDPEEPKEITYFTYRSQEFWDTSETDDWVIIHNQNGELLDYRAFEQNNTLEFKAIDTALVNTENLVVTTFSARQNVNINTHSLHTYTDIEKGFIWNVEIEENGIYPDNLVNVIKPNNLIVPKARSSSKAGTSNIIVNNVPGILKYNITSAATGVVTANYNPIVGNVLSLENLELLAGVNYIFFIGDAQGGLKHVFFEIDENTQDLVLDYDDFVDFEQIVETELPSNSYLFSVSRGYEDAANLGRGYEMTVELDFNSPTVSEIGYILGYELYSTVFHITLNSGYAYQYYELGETPLQQINILDKPDFTVGDNSLNSFNFSTDIDFIRTGSTWKYEENFPDGTYQYTSWNVNISNKKSHVVGNLPEEITTAYPKLELAKINHYSTYFTIQGKTYETLLNDLSNPLNSNAAAIQETIILYPSQD